MTLHYLDNEVPAFGEWDSVVTAGSSTIVQSADAAFPERPSTGSGLGLRCTLISTSPAYVQRSLSYTMPPGGWLYFGFWCRPETLPTSLLSKLYQWGIKGTGNHVDFYAQVRNSEIRLVARTDGGSGLVTSYYDVLTEGRWHWLVFALRRSTTAGANDGEFAMYCDGALLEAQSGKDFYTRFATLDSLRLGNNGACGVLPSVFDYDEIKIAESYPEPFTPTPETEYPEARRTVVLFRQASADSREFADHCVEQMGVPRANLCPLPNATANESLADYATFQTEVETDLAAWLGRNPTVAANCSCFLIGHGVPGYFTHSWLNYSATSRLMNYGTAFTPQTVNPLYNPATVARLTKTALGGKYLCSRIDADTLQHSKDILDCGLQIADCGFLPATDKLYSDDATYRASLACQHLRIITEAIGTFADDAFVWGDTGTPSFGAAGTRAVFADDSSDSADTLRATSELFDAIVTNSYAAGLGFSATPSALCPTPFFEMLRIGGTFAEAVAVASPYIDSAIVAIGSPLMTVAFQLGGYNVYRGFGGVEGIDWENPIAYLRPGLDGITLAQDLSPGQRYIYAVRFVSSAGIEERNTHVIAYAMPDEQGSLLPAPLARPTDPTVEVQQSSLLIGFSYLAPIGFAQADGFDILSDNGTGQLDLENPVATVEKSRNDRFDFEVSITRPDTPVLLAVRARRGEQVGPVSEVVFVPLVPAPASIQIL